MIARLITNRRFSHTVIADCDDTSRLNFLIASSLFLVQNLRNAFSQLASGLFRSHSQLQENESQIDCYDATVCIEYSATFWLRQRLLIRILAVRVLVSIFSSLPKVLCVHCPTASYVWCAHRHWWFGGVDKSRRAVKLKRSWIRTSESEVLVRNSLAGGWPGNRILFVHKFNLPNQRVCPDRGLQDLPGSGFLDSMKIFEDYSRWR